MPEPLKCIHLSKKVNYESKQQNIGIKGKQDVFVFEIGFGAFEVGGVIPKNSYRFLAWIHTNCVSLKTSSSEIWFDVSLGCYYLQDPGKCKHKSSIKRLIEIKVHKDLSYIKFQQAQVTVRGHRIETGTEWARVGKMNKWKNWIR